MIDSNKIMKDLEVENEELMAEETMTKIVWIKDKLESIPFDQWQLNTLVDHVATLCKIMPNLSDIKNDAYTLSLALSEEYKSAVRDRYIAYKQGEEKMTDKMAEELAKRDCDDIKERELQADNKARKLRDFHSDLERIVSFVQTKVKTAVDDRIRENIPNN